MVGLGGLEPPTSPLSGARSSHLSYRPYEIAVAIHCKQFISSMLPQFAVEYKLPF